MQTCYLLGGTSLPLSMESELVYRRAHHWRRDEVSAGPIKTYGIHLGLRLGLLLAAGERRFGLL